MHPIERLRYVARANGDSASSLVGEAAGALASFAGDPAALVTACRRLVDRQPHAGPIWWLAARVLHAAEPAKEAWASVEAIEADTTVDVLINEIPAEATVVLLGWPEIAASALPPRGDLDVLVVDVDGQGHSLARRLQRVGREVTLVEERGAAAAAAAAQLVLIEAVSMGGDRLAAIPCSLAAAAAAHCAGVPVWAVAGVGRVLPGRLWDAYRGRLDEAGDPWDNDYEFVPFSVIDRVVGPAGSSTPEEALRRADCPVAAELLRRV